MIREVKQYNAGESLMSSALLDEYWSGDPFLRPFYKHALAWDSFDSAMQYRDRSGTDRETLAHELEHQHQAFSEQFPLVRSNIDALRRSDCYTVTTGHQLCLATGPMFFLYKIITTINLCKELSKRHPGKHFVPVYWMATEDHDIAEIDHFQVNGQTLHANSSWHGPSGRQTVEDLAPLWDELQTLLKGKTNAEQVVERFRRAYVTSSSLADSTRALVLGLFGEEGLLVIDADRPVFKKMFASVLRQELFGGATRPVVGEVIDRMQVRHKAQVHVRELNLFYLQDHRRDRIERVEDGSFKVVDTDLTFSAEQIDEMLTRNPERFSPNVILRPLYQESILPDVATVGGPAEVAYWLLLLPLFELHGIPFPVLVPRNQALLLPGRALDKFLRQGFNPEEVFLPAEELTARWLSRNEQLQPSIEKARTQLNEVFESVVGLLSGIDATLESSVRAEAQRSMNGLDQLERKGIAALKRRHELALAQIRSIAERVKPFGSPQERIENFSGFASEYGAEALVKGLLDVLKPLDPRFTLLVME